GENRRVAGDRDERRLQRDGPGIETDLVLIVRRSVGVARPPPALVARDGRLELDPHGERRSRRHDHLPLVRLIATRAHRELVDPRRDIELRPSHRLAVQGDARALRHALERQPPGRAGRGWGGWLVGAGRVVPPPPPPPPPPRVRAPQPAAPGGAAGARRRGGGGARRRKPRPPGRARGGGGTAPFFCAKN